MGARTKTTDAAAEGEEGGGGRGHSAVAQSRALVGEGRGASQVFFFF
jgi:hypothetical protein